MHKSVGNPAMGLGVAAILIAAAGLVLSVRRPNADNMLQVLGETAPPHRVTVEYPLDETLFPPEIPSPCFRWRDDDPNSNLWLVSMAFADGGRRIDAFTRQPQWTPEPAVWDQIRKRSLDTQATVTIVGVNRKALSQILSAGRVVIGTSSDEVGAPLFYREVNLLFVEAVKDPSNIRWRFGSIASAQAPPVVLEKLPVCGNCHSFSRDGTVLGMDVDYANDKGSYAIVGVEERMTLHSSSVISWSEYKRNEGDGTYGLLSQVSPDGRYIVSTVKDESVFVPKPGLEFSQLFFPVKGILCIHDRQTGSFQALPGADDPNLVQSNATWSPDGKYIVFAATGVHHLQRAAGLRRLLLSMEECGEFLVEGKPFKFDLYRIPFNEGRGGKPEPLKGASFNGMSNFFPKYSPDGKWIVFCKAQNYMLLQPDSELYIIPAEGGEARRLRANTKRMNSWHSFSPNGRWLVFSGRPNSAYTQLFLTHIDEHGQSTPPVVLDRLTSSDRAANIPEFVNLAPTAIRHIREQFVDDLSYTRAAWEFLKSNDFSGAERQARKALELNPKNATAYRHLGLAMFGRKEHDEAIKYLSQAIVMGPPDANVHTTLGVAFMARNRYMDAARNLQKAVQIAPDHAEAHFNLGILMVHQGNRQEAAKHFSQAAELVPGDHEAHYHLAQLLEGQGNTAQAIEHYRQVVQLNQDHVMAHARLGLALCASGAYKEGLPYLSRAVALDPDNTSVRYNLAVTLAQLKQHDQAITHWLEILRRDSRSAGVLSCLAASYAATNQLDKALKSCGDALVIAQSAGDQQLVAQITRQIKSYGRPRP